MRVLCRQGGVCEEAERTETIVGCHHDHAGVLRQFLTVGARKIRRRSEERARVQPDDHGGRLGRRRVAHPDIQLQAIFETGQRSRGELNRGAIGWRSLRHEHSGCPGGWGLRRPPAIVAGRGSDVRDPEKRTRGAEIQSLHVAVRQRHETGRLRRSSFRGSFRPHDRTEHEQSRRRQEKGPRHSSQGASHGVLLLPLGIRRATGNSPCRNLLKSSKIPRNRLPTPP